jgi:cold-inducible RNA-binding protein
MIGDPTRVEKLIYKSTVINTKIYVDNLATATTENDLKQLFSRYGNVTEVNIPRDRASRRPRGFGFITMATSEGARSAIQALNGKAIGTCTLTASKAWSHEERAAPPGSPETPATVPAIVTEYISEEYVDLEGNGNWNEFNINPRLFMLKNYFGKLLFPRLQPSQYDQKFKIIAATLSLGLFVAGSLITVLMLRGVVGR